MDEIDINAIERKQKDTKGSTVDGRTARRYRNRDAVLDALIELARAGEVDPSIDRIAERAGVSYRSVYRYFSDRTELMLAAIGRILNDVWPLFDDDAHGDEPLDDRIDQFVTSRITAYRQLAPLTRQAIRYSLTEPTVAEGYATVRADLFAQVERHFANELDQLDTDERSVVLAAIDTMFQFEALEHLAQRCGLDDDSLRAVLTRQIQAHLDCARVG